MQKLGSESSATRVRSAWPWRGLGAALLAALAVHLFLLMAVGSRFVLSFQPETSQPSMSTRMVEPAPVSILPPAAQPAPTFAPTSTSTPTPSPRRVSNPSPAAKPNDAQENATRAPPAASAEPLPVEPPKNQENLPVAGVSASSVATETIAVSASSSQASLSSSVAAPAGGPAPPGVKLSYPASAVLQFDGINMRKGSAQSGSATLEWKTDGDRYELSLEASAMVIFSRTEKSVGLLSAQGLAPQRYSSVSTGRSEQATHFRADSGKIQFSNNKPDQVLLVGAQDRLSAFIQLAGILGGDPERYRIVNRIQMQVATLDSAEVWEFNLSKVSDINVPAANMQALKITRSPRSEYDQLLEIWLSPQLGYLPIRIRQSSTTTPEQDFTDLVLRKLP